MQMDTMIGFGRRFQELWQEDDGVIHVPTPEDVSTISSPIPSVRSRFMELARTPISSLATTTICLTPAEELDRLLMGRGLDCGGR